MVLQGQDCSQALLGQGQIWNLSGLDSSVQHRFSASPHLSCARIISHDVEVNINGFFWWFAVQIPNCGRNIAWALFQIRLATASKDKTNLSPSVQFKLSDELAWTTRSRIARKTSKLWWQISMIEDACTLFTRPRRRSFPVALWGPNHKSTPAKAVIISNKQHCGHGARSWGTN